MNNDEREFERWRYKTPNRMMLPKIEWEVTKEAWFAAIESERKRSKKLLEALKFIDTLNSDDDFTNYDIERLIYNTLKEYQGGDE